MNPKTVKKLTENTPEFKELISYLIKEAEKLNVLNDIQYTTTAAIALEVKARIRAYDKIMDMIKPLISTQTGLEGVNPAEYVV